MSRCKLRAVGIWSVVICALVTINSGSVARADGDTNKPPTIRAAKSLTKLEVHSGRKGSAAVYDKYELADLEAAAKSSGVSLATLKATHVGVADFATAVDAVQAAEPDTFVQAGVGTAEDPTPWIVFTVEPDIAVLAKLANLPVDVDVLYGAPASYVELERTASNLVDALKAQAGVISAGAGVVGKGDRISAFYTREASAARSAAPLDDSAVENQALQAVAKATKDGRLPVQVDIEERPAGVGATATVAGGRDLNLADSNAAECTGGYTATRNGEKGLITAQHCANGLRYVNSLGVIQYVTAARNSLSGHTDLQFHRTLSGSSTSNQFRATGYSSSDRTVIAAANPVSGQVACHWGRTTNYSCNVVDSTNFCAYYYNVDLTFCNLDSTQTRIDKPGDSGGPWFYGEQAIGIHSGGADDGSFSLFTRIGAAKDFLDATVLHS